MRAEISSAGIAGSGHLLHVKVYKRNSRLLPLFSVGTRSYVKDVQSAHDYTDYWPGNIGILHEKYHKSSKII